MDSNINEEIRIRAENIAKGQWPNMWVMPIYFLVMGLVSFALGCCIIFTVLKYFRKKMHIDLKMGLFMVILDTLSAVDGILCGIFQLPPLQYYVKYHSLCMAQSMTSGITFLGSMIILGVVALERCLLVVYKIKLSDKYYWLMIFCSIGVTLFNVVISSTTNSIELQPSGAYCLYSHYTPYGKATYAIMIIFVGLSFTSLIICYIQIVFNRNITSKREQLALGLDPAKVKRDVNRTTFKLLLILGINVTTNIPYVIYNLLGLVNPEYLNPIAAFFIIPPLISDIWWNSILYLILNIKIYYKLKEVLFGKSEEYNHEIGNAEDSV
jgi:hypothetical protein